jgi:thiamine biosynthesis lipoprotein
MGTEFSIALVCDLKTVADAEAAALEAQIQAYEKRFSRFIPESELSQLNIQKDMIVSDVFFEVIQEAYALFVQTKGIFNPLIQIERLGYDKSFETISPLNAIEPSDVYNIDFTTTVIDTVAKRIILQVGQKLDFGGFLKGYLATKLCTSLMDKEGITGAIVNIGGDLHACGLDATEVPFVFEVYNPITHKNIEVTLTNKSLATSGTYKRTWQYRNTSVHHILDSTGTKNPETDVVQASIIHAQGSVAEAYAKVFLSVGTKKARRVIDDQSFLYITIHTTGTIESNIL